MLSQCRLLLILYLPGFLTRFHTEKDVLELLFAFAVFGLADS